MAKDKSDDSEYQFKDEQEHLEYDYEEQPVTGGRKKIKRRPILLVIGILIAIFVVYKLVEILFVGRPQTAAKPVVEKTKQVTVQVRKPQPFESQPAVQMQARQTATISATTKPTVSSMQQTPASLDGSPASISSITRTSQLSAQPKTSDALAKKTAELLEKNKTLVSTLQRQQFQNQASLLTMEDNVKQVNERVSELSETIGHMQNTVDAAHDAVTRLTRARATAKARRERAIRRRRAYFVDAVIPGRAWLKGRDGTATTVAVGDQLRGYGKVLSINPYSGQVRTSRATIRYGVSH